MRESRFLLLCLLLLLYPVANAAAETKPSYTQMIEICRQQIESNGEAAGIEYLERQYALYPEYPSLLYCLGELTSKWDDRFFSYYATEEACDFYLRAYEASPDIPEHKLGRALVAYCKEEDYEKAAEFASDFLNSVAFQPDGNSIIWDAPVGIRSCLDMYSTACFIAVDSYAQKSDRRDFASVDLLLSKIIPMVNPNKFEIDCIRRGMETLYWGIQYYQFMKCDEKALQYAQDYICLFEIMMTQGDYTDKSDADLEYISELHTELYVHVFSCIEILMEQYGFNYPS